ncbi:hypothetical protein DRE_02888 [Drechslerella stenobrocha 248]|uniref:Uncharacterized protein n=1 Tax=Drechslerella stenobrocha 248 TaxID=1043628 RepID=W7I692_9PEZI|nr:hypothetical protein DRE_02888 [Drechslerella stenobrocha 248]
MSDSAQLVDGQVLGDAIWGFSDEELTAGQGYRRTRLSIPQTGLGAVPKDDGWGFGGSDDENIVPKVGDCTERVSTNKRWGFDGSDEDTPVATASRSTEVPLHRNGSEIYNDKPSKNVGWGFGDSDVEESKASGPIIAARKKKGAVQRDTPLLKTPLGAAVAALDAATVRRLVTEPAHDVQIVDLYNNTLLHLLANPQLNENAAAQFTCWDQLLQRTREVLSLLVDSGLEIEAVNKINETPLSAAIGWRYQDYYPNDFYPSGRLKEFYKCGEGHVIIALLEAGARVNRVPYEAESDSNLPQELRELIRIYRPRHSSFTISHGNLTLSYNGTRWAARSAIDMWIAMDPTVTRFPDRFDDVLQALLADRVKTEMPVVLGNYAGDYGAEYGCEASDNTADDQVGGNGSSINYKYQSAELQSENPELTVEEIVEHLTTCGAEPGRIGGIMASADFPAGAKVAADVGLGMTNPTAGILFEIVYEEEFELIL